MTVTADVRETPSRWEVSAATSTRPREHLEVTAVVRPEDVEVPAVQAGDRARPVPLGQHHDRCIRHSDLPVPVAGDDPAGAAKPLFVESGQVPPSAGQFVEHGQPGGASWRRTDRMGDLITSAGWSPGLGGWVLGTHMITTDRMDDCAADGSATGDER
jgi:hypothetical protein